MHDEWLSRSGSSHSLSSREMLLYENILLHKTTISKPKDSIINEHINLPRRLSTGVLCLFTEQRIHGTRDTEKFVNPDIKFMNINIDGVKLEIKRKTGGTFNINCYMFVVADELMEVMNTNLKSIL